MKELTKDEVKDSLMKFGKYKGKTLREISQIDVFYLIWYYWEVASGPKCWNWSNLTWGIDELVKEAGHCVTDEKPFEKLKEITFGKHKGKDFDYIFKYDRKYFLWLYISNKDRENPNKNMLYTMSLILKENDCIYYGSKRGLEYCKCCKTFHNIK